MTAPTERRAWEFEVRPRLMSLGACGAALFIAVAHIVVAFLLKLTSTGVLFQTSDQVAIIVLGLILAGALLLLTRPRLRVSADGLAVRNLFGERLIGWPEVVGVYFPVGKRWARVELPGDEYIPVMAIQAVDKERAVDAMERVRELVARYCPPDEQGAPPSAEQT